MTVLLSFWEKERGGCLSKDFHFSLQSHTKTVCAPLPNLASSQVSDAAWYCWSLKRPLAANQVCPHSPTTTSPKMRPGLPTGAGGQVDEPDHQEAGGGEGGGGHEGDQGGKNLRLDSRRRVSRASDIRQEGPSTSLNK